MNRDVAIARGSTMRVILSHHDGAPPTREKVLERALTQIEGNAMLAINILGRDNSLADAWDLVVAICQETFASVGRNPKGEDAVERLRAEHEHAVPPQAGDAQ